MDKVKLPKRIFDFIQSERYFDTNKENYWKERVLLTILTHEFSLEDVKFETIIQALATDYEVEETPEDKVKLFYETASTNKSILLQHSAISYDEVELQNGIMRGIEGTLNRLNIKIEGIN
jgi:metal-dependent HD superfamily phosphatase/phosphodiesterase